MSEATHRRPVFADPLGAALLVAVALDGALVLSATLQLDGVVVLVQAVRGLDLDAAAARLGALQVRLYV